MRYTAGRNKFIPQSDLMCAQHGVRNECVVPRIGKDVRPWPSNQRFFTSINSNFQVSNFISMFLQVIPVAETDKKSVLIDILNDLTGEKVLVFVEEKRQADFLASYLSLSGFPTTSIHGNRDQFQREEALRLSQLRRQYGSQWTWFIFLTWQIVFMSESQACI